MGVEYPAKIQTAVVGIGNVLLSDEGLGVHAAGYLGKYFTGGEQIEFIDGGTMGLDLLPFIEDRRFVLFIDAIDFGKEPGYVGKITEDGLKYFSCRKFSVHQIGLADILSALKLINRPPREILLVGMQPEKVEPGTSLSNVAAASFPMLIDNVLYELRIREISVRKLSEGLRSPDCEPFVPQCSFHLPPGDLFPFPMI